MRKISFLYIIVMLSCLLMGCKRNKSISSLIPQISAELIKSRAKKCALIDSITRIFPENTQIAVCFNEENGILLKGAKNGLDSVESVLLQDSIFEIGSITKIFTSTLLAQAVLAGKIDLQKPINQYLPFTMDHGDEITCTHLANHTSGLPRLPTNLFDSETIMANPYATYTYAELEKYLQGEIELQSEVGARYAYSNLAVGILEYILTQLYRTSYEQLLQDSIFHKAFPMIRSSTERSKFVQIVQGLDYNGDPTLNWDFEALAGAGAIKSSVSDLMIFVNRFMYETSKSYLLTMEETFRVNSNLSLGLGWHIITIKSGDTLYFHNGGTQGYTSHLSFHKETGSYVIILSNVSAFHPSMNEIDELGFSLMMQNIEEKKALN